MKLEVENQWEYLTYKFNGTPINEKIGGKVKLTNGDVVSYRSVIGYKDYDDMGHTYTTKRYLLIASIKYNNQVIDVNLADLDIEEFLN